MPTVCALHEAGYALHLLSLTTGNADGLGSQRVAELHAVAEALHLAAVTVLNRSAFADGFGEVWDVDAAAEAVRMHILKSSAHFELVVTFDELGVTGHPNHRDTHLAVRGAARRLTGRWAAFMSLRTRSLSRAFSANLEALALALTSHHGQQQSGDLLFWAHSPAWSWHAMTLHTSQWLWFRKLYVLLSRYSYINELQPFELPDEDSMRLRL